MYSVLSICVKPIARSSSTLRSTSASVLKSGMSGTLPLIFSSGTSFMSSASRSLTTGSAEAVHILDIDYPLVDMGRQCLYGIGGAAQRAFYREPPVAGAERDEGCDESVLRHGLAATEADASARGLEVDIVHLHHLVEFQWRDPVYSGRQGVGVTAVAVAAHIVVAAVVEAIPALQRLRPGW